MVGCINFVSSWVIMSGADISSSSSSSTSTSTNGNTITATASGTSPVNTPVTTAAAPVSDASVIKATISAMMMFLLF
ncbi:hypothetical protein PROFUN_03108 [Planoprotostelium fungivorum]|uniref:Uncharacterized protein n=1 Tax=Planoprotostelium fungivorum TaxID=1890364 RepID=A0A2P6NQ86_9EUKA|nr:hypothetical protein PROFUN_03108 [Planoprotostelium fungivorum]